MTTTNARAQRRKDLEFWTRLNATVMARARRLVRDGESERADATLRVLGELLEDLPEGVELLGGNPRAIRV